MTAASKFTILDSVDSTNNYAMARVRDGVASDGQAWFSYEQTHGKGRRGNVWRAEKSKNVILSIAVDTAFLTVLQQFQLSVAASLGCLEVIKKYVGDETSIKWPNDILWNDRKAGGILIENIIKGSKWQWAVIGIGININQTRFDVYSNFSPVSLKQITGKEYDIVQIAKEIHRSVLHFIEDLKKKDFETMLVLYNRNLFGNGQKVKMKKGNVVFETTVKGVTPDGKLITSGPQELFEVGEVIWL